MKQYKINEETLRDLLACEHTLDALKAGGVKNWEWYEESLSRSDVLDVEEALKEFDIVDLEQENAALKSELAQVKAENERLREALKFYALRKHFYGEKKDALEPTPEHHDWIGGTYAELVEDGFVALQALKAEASA